MEEQKKEVKTAEEFEKKLENLEKKEGLITPKKEYLIKPKETSTEFKTPLEENKKPIAVENTENVEKLKKSKHYLIKLIIILIILLLIGLILRFTLFGNSKTKDRYLGIGENVEETLVKEGTIAYVTLTENINLNEVSKISIIFNDAKDGEYTYQSEEISLNYEISAEDLGLENFDNIIVARASFEYIAEPTTLVNDTPTITNQTNQTAPTRPIPSGGGSVDNSGGGSTCTPKTCANYAGKCGSFDNNCGGTINCGCGENYECISGNCIELIDCDSDINCTYLNGTCGLGFCNIPTQKCQVNYNLTTDVCKSSQGPCDITETCSGSLNCPTDLFNSSSTICRTNSTECDAIDYCSGSSEECTDNNKDNGEICSGGTCNNGKCVSPECTEDSDCSPDGCYSSSYPGEFRDYFCSNSNMCEYNIETKQENLTNNNCNDGLDNDCDYLTDQQESRCKQDFPTDYVAYWKFEDNVLDETGNNNGTLKGNATIISDSLRGNVLDLDGDNDYVDCGDGNLSGTDEFTISYWIKPHIDLNKDTGDPWRWYGSVGEGNDYYVGWQDNTVGITTSFMDTSNNRHFTDSFNDPLTKDQWYHVVGTYDGYIMNIYLNGNIAASKFINSYNIKKTTNTFKIGGWTNAYFNATIDDVMVYDRALDFSEVRDLYTSQGGSLYSVSPFVRFWKWVKNLIT